MTLSIAFSSLKGGVGKTTSALNCAFAFARRGVRTLLVDADPQGAVGLSLDGVKEREGFAAALRRGDDLLSVAIQTRLPELKLVSMGPVGAQEIDDIVSLSRDQQIFSKTCTAAEAEFDVVIFDTPAGLGGMTRLTLEAVEHVVAVAQCEPLALRALPQLLELLAHVRDLGSRCSLLGVLGNMSSFRDPVMLASLEELWALYQDLVFDTSIPRDANFLQASRAGVPLGLLSSRPPSVAAVFDSLVAEIEERLGGELEENDGPIRLVV